jgi:GH25 family lysozyme M1 (1,4-beta-N-acetylmuramidase)
MQIKLPLVIDTSNYELGLDISTLLTRPSALITRASYGIANPDQSCQAFNTQARQASIPFGVYHYFDNSKSSADQAKFFWSCVSGKLRTGDKLILDYEDRTHPFSLHAAVDFFYNLNLLSGIPVSEMIFYSQADILNTLNPSTSDWNYIKSIPFWTAGYPNNPDQYNSVPPAYVPSGMNASNVVLWQYGSSGIVQPYSGSLDVDWIAPAFLTAWQAEYQAVSIPPVVTPPPVTDNAQWNAALDASLIAIQGLKR